MNVYPSLYKTAAAPTGEVYKVIGQNAKFKEDVTHVRVHTAVGGAWVPVVLYRCVL